jgi:hypothetical protein
MASLGRALVRETSVAISEEGCIGDVSAERDFVTPCIRTVVDTAEYKRASAARTRRISRVVTNIYDQALRSHGVNASQFSLLVLIAKLGGASRAEIGRANYQDRSTLTILRRC